jgi:hypothetical protein
MPSITREIHIDVIDSTKLEYMAGKLINGRFVMAAPTVEKPTEKNTTKYNIPPSRRSRLIRGAASAAMLRLLIPRYAVKR